MKTTYCPNCQHKAGFDPSTGEIFCDLCCLLELPGYLAARKPFATCTVWQPVPGLRDQHGKHPWHAVYLEMHLMGIWRGMFRNDLSSTRYNKAAGIEWMYQLMGLVSHFAFN